MISQNLTSQIDLKAYFCYYASGSPVRTYDYFCFAVAEDIALAEFKQWLKTNFGDLPEGICIARDITYITNHPNPR